MLRSVLIVPCLMEARTPMQLAERRNESWILTGCCWNAEVVESHPNVDGFSWYVLRVKCLVRGNRCYVSEWIRIMLRCPHDCIWKVVEVDRPRRQ